MVFYIFGGRSIVVVVQLVFVAKLSKQILTKAREPSLLYTFYMLGNSTIFPLIFPTPRRK